MDQADDRPDRVVAQFGEPVVAPLPIGRFVCLWRDVFPEDWKPHRVEPEARQQRDVVLAVTVAGRPQLVTIDIADPINRALAPAPCLESGKRTPDRARTFMLGNS